MQRPMNHQDDQKLLCWEIPTTSESPLHVSLELGNPFFIIGANGSGKSALVHHFVLNHRDLEPKPLWLSAHRQTWFDSASINLTPRARDSLETQTEQQDAQADARWKDNEASRKQIAALYDLVEADNELNRGIVAQFREVQDFQKEIEGVQKAYEHVKQSPSLYSQISQLLLQGGFTVEIPTPKNLGGGKELQGKRTESQDTYSIAKMSDGERSALVLAIRVLTAESGRVLLIDEPERHLHRSIIVPFVTALVQARGDCFFIISTHEVALLDGIAESQILILQSCQWNGDIAKSWDIFRFEPSSDYEQDTDVLEALRRDILGSRKKTLFVEGTGTTSLDKPLYESLFPNVSIVCKENCELVIKVVSGLQNALANHDLEAFGVVDNDGRTDQQIVQLEQKNVFTLPVYSVESLYYCRDSIVAVAGVQAEKHGWPEDKKMEKIQSAIESVLNTLKEKDVDNRMAARRCEKTVRTQLQTNLPDWKEIWNNPCSCIGSSVSNPFKDELKKFQKLLADRDFDSLVARYPIRKTGAFDKISNTLDLTNSQSYQSVLTTPATQRRATSLAA